MPRFFNTAGVCEPRDHYMLPPLDRLPGLVPLIDKKSYFVVHAPRQSGKLPPPGQGAHGRGVNGGGFIDREYAVGSGRVDLCIRWPLADGTVQRLALELKVRRPGRGDPGKAGLEQLAGYLERLSLNQGTLVIFDLRPDAPPFAERGSRETKTVAGRKILVLRL